MLNFPTIFVFVVILVDLCRAVPAAIERAPKFVLKGKRDGAVAPCLDGSSNDTAINLAFYYGGPGTTVALCAGVTINLYNPILFTAAGQSLITLGNPTDDTRATLNISSPNLGSAIVGSCDACASISVGYLQINGNRPLYGRLATEDGGSALLEMGGSGGNQLIEYIHAYEPRGWSVLHAIEGGHTSERPACSGITIRNNQIGPSGTSPNQGVQYVRLMDAYRMYLRLSPVSRAATGVNAPGEWADGISLACTNSSVTNNVVTDATDGGIVIFGAPGSTISGNTIRATSRNLLGGINMVDYGPYDGNYTDTVVTDNSLQTDGAMIKLGIAMGTMSWGSYNNTSFRTYNGIVKGNRFSSSADGYFGYGISAAGHNTTTVSDNVFTGALFSGAKSAACIPDPYAPPKPQEAVFDPYTTSGSFQSGFTPNTLVFLICLGPVGSAGSTGWAKRSSIATQGLEPLDDIVARSLRDGADVEETTRVLARAVFEDAPDVPPAPRATGAFTGPKPVYISDGRSAPGFLPAVRAEKRATLGR